jgi:two-component system response regulator FixJ
MANPAVFIVDDDDSFSRAIARFLRASGHETRTFGSAREFLLQLRPEMRGCLLLDLEMPGLNGLELQENMIGAGIAMPIVFLTGHGDIPSTVRAMRRGAEDFLTKRASQEELLAAVERALAREVQERRKRDRMDELLRRFAMLSEREMEVLGHVVRGRLNKQIAADLGINERTVKLHRTSITRKLRMQSVAELTRCAKEAGLFETEDRLLP